MALDAAMLHVVAHELAQQLSGSRIDKLYMPSRDEVLFLLRRPEGTQKLLLSARSGSARLHITEEEFENPATPPAFCMLLRKYLTSGRLTGVRPVDGERVLFIDVEALNEMGDRVSLTLSVELMGRYSNLVLIDAEGVIIDALKRIDIEQSEKRQLLPGLLFTLPPAQDKLPFPGTSNQTILECALRIAKPLSAALLDSVAGLGPVLCREIAWRIDGDPDADSLSDDQRAKLEKTIDALRSAMDNESERRFTIVSEGGKPVEFSFFPLTQYGTLPVEHFETAGKLLDCYYAERDCAERARARSHNLSRQVTALRERALRKQQARLSDRDDTGKAAQKKLCGELIQANLHALQKGMRSAELFNYYDNTTISVALDPMRTPVENAQKYYKEYKKLMTAAFMLDKLLADGADEIAYLESVQYEITQAATEEDFLAIRRELYEAGFLRGSQFREKREKRDKRKAAGVLRFTTSAGMTVLVGRNNDANDRLTLHTADRRDIWFHVKNAPGSHVILVTGQIAPDDRSRTEAAELAVWFSSQHGGQKVAVDYTQVKNVKKAPGQRAGMVYYEHYSTAFVTPAPDIAARLAEPKQK